MLTFFADPTELVIQFGIRIGLCRRIVNQEERKRTKMELIKDHRARLIKLRTLCGQYYIGGEKK